MSAPVLPDRVTAYLDRSGLGAEATTVLPLTGDASDRRYFRVLRRNGPSRVLALHGEPFDSEALPFCRVAQLLAAMPLPIPAILDRAGDLGILLLEDLGDITLQAHLGAAPAAEHSRLYRYAVSLIEALQRRGAELASPAYPPYGVAFDVDKLLWELDFFTKHYVEAYRGASISAPDRDALKVEWRRLAEELAGEPRVLCHRDYHSRNLMLHQGELYIIDFQDARMGPDTYDLVSLLRDSYVDLSEATVDELIAYFIALKRPQGGDAIAHRALGAGLPPALRRDGAAAQPQGARHVRLSDQHASQSGLHPVHPAHDPARADEPAAQPRPVRAPARAAGPLHGRTPVGHGATEHSATETHRSTRRSGEPRGQEDQELRFRLDRVSALDLSDASVSLWLILPALWRFALRPGGPYTRGLGRTAREAPCSSACPRISTTTHGSTGTIWWRLRHTGSARSRSSRPARTSTTTTRRFWPNLSEHLRDSGLRAHSVHAPITESLRDGVWGPAYSLATTDEAARTRAVDETIVALRAAEQLQAAFLVLHLGVPLAQQPDGRDNRRDAVLRSLEARACGGGGVGGPAGARGHPQPDLGRRRAGDGDRRRARGHRHRHLPRQRPRVPDGRSGRRDRRGGRDTWSRRTCTTIAGSSDDHLVPFDGAIDWAEAAMTLQKVGYEGVWLFELAATDTPRRVLERAQSARRRLERFLSV